MDSFFNIDMTALAKAAGYLGISLIIFSESGLFFGFFLPGDSLLFAAGLLASTGYFEIIPLTFLVFIAAFLGDQVGYVFGRKIGPKIFTREDSFLFRKKHIEQAHDFYLKHGKKTIVLARFVPVVRTFAPIVAGVGNMHYKTFVSYNLIGGFIWAVGATLLGYFLGEVFPEAEKYIIPLIFSVIFISLLPPLFAYLKHRGKKD